MPTPPSPAPPRTSTAADLPALLEELAASGLSAAAFARERGIPVWQLYRARRAAAAGSPSKVRRKKRSLVSVSVVDPPAAASPPLELRLPSGLGLLIPPDFDEAGLRRLMGVLASC